MVRPKDKMTLVWRDHSKYLQESLALLKRFNQSTDVTLICGDEEEIQAHKIVLSAGSQLFYSLLDNVPTACVVYLPEVTFKDLSLIIEYLYFGETSVNQSDLNSILSLAEGLGIKSIVEKLNKIQNKFHFEKQKNQPTSYNEEHKTKNDFVTLIDKPKESALFRCIDCCETFDAKQDLNNHLKNHRKYDCEYCEEEFSERSSLLDHIIAMHNNEDTDVPDTDSFIEKYSIKKPRRGRPHKDIKYECDECNEVFSRKLEFFLHKSHSHETKDIKNIKKTLTQFPCTKCSIVCRSAARLQKHLWKHDKFSCKFCGSYNRSMKLLLRHNMRFHKEEISFDLIESRDFDAKQDSNNPEPDTDPLNEQNTTNKRQKDSNVRKSFQCPDCKKVFSGLQVMKHHYEIIHKGLRIPCNKCDYKTGNTSHLEEHIDSVHLGIKYDCPVCGKRITHKSHVRRHCKIKHPSWMDKIVFSEINKTVD